MRRISIPGRDEDGSILLDVLVSIIIISLTLSPFAMGIRQLRFGLDKQTSLLNEAALSTENKQVWYFEDDQSD